MGYEERAKRLGLEHLLNDPKAMKEAAQKILDEIEAKKQANLHNTEKSVKDSDLELGKESLKRELDTLPYNPSPGEISRLVNKHLPNEKVSVSLKFSQSSQKSYFFNEKYKRNIFIVVTALVVAYVRTELHYGRLWDSVFSFLSSWLIHYIALGLFILITGAFIIKTEKFFFENRDVKKYLSIDEAIIYITSVVFVLAITIFLLSRFVPI